MNNSLHSPLGDFHQHLAVYKTGICVLGRVCEDFLHLELDTGEFLDLYTARMPDEQSHFYFVRLVNEEKWEIVKSF